MYINADKTTALIATGNPFEEKITPDATIVSIHIDGIPENQVQSQEYLSVIIDKHLRYDVHPKIDVRLYQNYILNDIVAFTLHY